MPDKVEEKSGTGFAMAAVGAPILVGVFLWLPLAALSPVAKIAVRLLAIIPSLLYLLVIFEALEQRNKLPGKLQTFYKTTIFRGITQFERRTVLGLAGLVMFVGYWIFSIWAVGIAFFRPFHLYVLLFLLLVTSIRVTGTVYHFWRSRHPQQSKSTTLFLILEALWEFRGWLRRKKIVFITFMGTYFVSIIILSLLPGENMAVPVLLFLVSTGVAASMVAYSIDWRRSEQLEQELRTAREMQMGLMPKEDPVVKGFDISGICLPATEVGGDFYDYVWLDKKKTTLGITIADVSGKAMKAAMTAVMTSGMLYSEVEKSKRPREILARINRPLYLRTDKRVFTTMAFAAIDVKNKILVYSSAGHPPPLIVQKNKVHYLKAETTGLPLGIQEELFYKEARVKLQHGNTVIFYTDGISEAMNELKEQYGTERLEALVKNVSQGSARDLREKILADVKAFTGNAEQHDDMTVVVVKVQ